MALAQASVTAGAFLGGPLGSEGCSPAMRGPQHHTQGRRLGLWELAGGSLAFWGPGAFLLRVGPSPSFVDVHGSQEKLLGLPVSLCRLAERSFSGGVACELGYHSG